ncbi:hypothetical protein [Dryocola sp. BD626]|jgi:glycerophosphoryl diester phosphodiesterase|uniref:hypothetical protein n=1 Tax=Dryocola sp. BD626 TaxID=3133273 RepID=UPI003F50467E
MQFLAHRGAWLSRHEQNTPQALHKALVSGWGIETDIRDLNGELVISHDMPRNGALSVAQFLDDYIETKATGMLALNIKADGLTATLKQLLDERGITRYFCFDMSVPDSLAYLKHGMSTAARLSEYENEGMLSEAAKTLWVDGFSHLNVKNEQLARWLDKGKQVCLVSPELHGRDPFELWQQLAWLPDELRLNQNLMLCTDNPATVSEIVQ